MSEELGQEPTQEQGDQESQTGERTPDAGSVAASVSNNFDSLPDWAQSQIKDLRKENAGHRKGKQAAEKAAQDAEDKRLADQQEWQTLAEKRQVELDGLKPLQERIEGYQETVQKILTTRLTEYGETAKVAVENLPGKPDALAQLQWLEANVALFATPRVPDTDAAKRNQDKRSDATDEDVQEFAARMGVNPEYVDRSQLVN